MDPADLQLFADKIITEAVRPSEVDLRRAISAIYYALFHRLALASANVFANGGPALQAQVVRAFAHTTMKDVCTIYSKPRTGPYRQPFAALIPVAPDVRLVSLAKAFIELQEARLTADYNLAITHTRQQAFDILQLARTAYGSFIPIEHAPETRVFLTALLLADRWARRG